MLRDDQALLAHDCCTHRNSVPLYLFGFLGIMWANLDQIEFYHGPSGQPPSTSEKRPPTYVTQFQCSFPTRSAFVQGPMNIPEYPAPLEQEPPSTAINHAWNAFDVEMIETEPVVTTDILATLDASLDLGSDPLSLSEPVAFEDCVTPALTTDQLDHVTPHVQENSSSGKRAQTLYNSRVSTSLSDMFQMLFLMWKWELLTSYPHLIPIKNLTSQRRPAQGTVSQALSTPAIATRIQHLNHVMHLIWVKIHAQAQPMLQGGLKMSEQLKIIEQLRMT
ncbi:hypothetical protein EYZ11_012450 [Aspergillus tanneri]|uniref:Uncharacterized protein n=1 Tax=Aspergillus tanneri TaxID=1220188 RepID=A0A4S3J0T0_9EURO|nr:hypothetical protein EYZ11_012450 [Aspergillus tanneri]